MRCLLAIACLITLSFAATYQNPVYPGEFADPCIILIGSTYYAYASDEGQYNIPTLVSRDGSLSNWQFVGDSLPRLPSWAQANAGLTWAPAVIKLGNQYVMYYTARYTVTGKQCVSYATSSSPTGPFVDPNTSAPWLCQLEIGGTIDPSPYLDTNGDLYLLFKNDGNCCGFKVNLWGQRLTSNGTAFLPGTSPTALITNDQPWEGNLVEAPTMMKLDSTYYLYYSANNYESYQYAVGYATCTTPIGPCAKPTYSPIISYYGSVWGPGGETPFQDVHGKWWFCYHGWTAPNATYPDGSRTLRLDRLNFVSGVPILADHVPTTRPVSYNP